ncbi:MAG TPA: lipoate--protein ligase [Clostridia bacterium]|nr:lipoate--protein ligase [Clostridia bacterium]
MVLISHNHVDPSFNLACEEYFLQHRQEEFMLLWRNEPSIIIGRNQNAYSEIDMDFTSENSIPIIRRLTGGGTVFHDLGNLNFTFIKNGQDGFADFVLFLEPITGYLRSLGLNAQFSGRNDILLNDMKISGNAQVNYKGRVMVHGTLLFSIAMERLARALKPNKLKLRAKGIKSVRSRVTNISEHLKRPMSIEEFIDGLYKYLSSFDKCEISQLTEKDVEEIERIADEKYRQWEWNIGKAPKYKMEGSVMLPVGIVTAYFDIKAGKIESLKLVGDFFSQKDIDELEQKLIGCRHDKSEIIRVLNKIDISKHIVGITAEELAQVFFNIGE